MWHFYVWHLHAPSCFPGSPYVAAWVSTFRCFTAKQYFIACIYHILFVHSLIDGHWVVSAFSYCEYVKLWAFTYTFSVNTCFQFSGHTPNSWILGYMVGSLMFNFWGTARMFSKVAALLHPISNMGEKLNFSISSPILTSYCLGCSHPSAVQWYFIMFFVCISRMTNNVGHLFRAIGCLYMGLKKYLLNFHVL